MLRRLGVASLEPEEIGIRGKVVGSRGPIQLGAAKLELKIV